jgi:two-component system chemotaxis sensor kinase CheA
MILNPLDLIASGLKQIVQRRPSQRVEVVDNRPDRRKRLLIAEDSLTTRTLERSILESAGYEVLVAVDGQDALDVLHAQSVDLVVSDVEMPRMNGFSLTAEIRRDERLRHIPVVLVTGLDSSEYHRRGLAAGADAYIVKSRFDQSDLIEAVGRLL